MARIKADLVGVVYVYGPDGSALPEPLAAGDDVPEGVTVGDHLLDAKAKDAGETTASSTAKPAAARKPSGTTKRAARPATTKAAAAKPTEADGTTGELGGEPGAQS